MADNTLELMAEADRRGILPPDKKALFDEAKARGLVGTPAAAQPKESMSNAQAIDEIVKMAHPMSWVSKFMDKGAQALDRAAYNVGGKVTDIASGFGASPEVAAGAGYAANVATQAVPTFLSGTAAKSAAPYIESAAQKLMTSALKPSVTMGEKGAASAVQTLLDNGINVSEGGLAKLRGLIDDVNREIADKIRNLTATVDKGAVWDAVKQKLDYFKKQVNPQSDISTIKQAWADFVNHPLVPSPVKDIPVQLAQEMKQTTGTMLSKKYGQLSSADEEVQKAITRGLKDEIAKGVPGIQGLNEFDSKLYQALTPLEKRVIVDMRNNPVGISVLAHSPAAFAAAVLDRSSPFKSMLARMVYAGKEQIPATAARIGVGAAEAANNQ